MNSLRWEAVRDGIEDYDYLALLESLIRECEAGGRAPGLCRQGRKLLDVDAVTRSFTDYTTSPEAIEAQRVAIARVIEKLQAQR